MNKNDWDNILMKKESEGMKRISSSLTFFNKRIFPAIWFGFLAVFFVISASTMLLKKNTSNEPPFIFLLAPCFMAVMGFFIMKMLVWDLVDEVLDAGDSLIVRNRSLEERVLFANIMNISHSSFSNPPRVILHLRQAGIFGKEIAFAPKAGFVFFPFLQKNPLIDDLIERVDAARRPPLE